MPGKFGVHSNGARRRVRVSYHKRGRWGGYYSDEDDDEVPSMLEVENRSLSIKNLVDLNGVPMLDSRTLPLSEENLIPENAFEDAEPDDSQYEGYMGNVSYLRCLPLLFY